MATKQWNDQQPTSGTYWTKVTDVTKVATTQHGTYGVLVDVDPGFNQDNFFELQRFETRVPSVSGEEINSSGNAVKIFSAYPVGYRPQPPSVSTLGGLPSWAELQNKCIKVAALTNPSRALVSLPTTLGEMRDIPAMTQRLGRNALAAVAKGYVTWRFAYKPLLNDLKTISKFTRSVVSRFEYLRKLSERKWVGKTVTLGSTSVDLPRESVMIHSEGAYISGYRYVRVTRKEWASMRWKLLCTLPPSVMARYDLADRLVKGVTSYETLQMAWELTPWSWLVDWFYGLGDYIAANNNTIPALPGGFCWMATDTATSSYAVISKPEWVTLSGAHFEKTTRKIRLVPGVSSLIPPVPVLPILTNGQASILGGLVLSRTNFGPLKMRNLALKPR